MSGSVLSPTNVRHDADRLHPLRRTESDRDVAYLIRTLLRFSAQRERGLRSPTSSAAASREKSGSVQSVQQFQVAVLLSRADANFLQTMTARLPGEVDRGLTPKTAAMMNYPV